MNAKIQIGANEQKKIELSCLSSCVVKNLCLQTTIVSVNNLQEAVNLVELLIYLCQRFSSFVSTSGSCWSKL